MRLFKRVSAAGEFEPKEGRIGVVRQADRFLNAALDSWINLIDTSPDYDSIEVLIGKFFTGRRESPRCLLLRYSGARREPIPMEVV